MNFRHRTFLLAGVSAATFLVFHLPSSARAADRRPPTSECDTTDLLAGKVPQRQENVEGDPKLVTDGAVVSEGAEWDAPAAITWDSRPGSITYDLGRAKVVSAFLVQADANDVYVIAGSLDDSSDSYKIIARAVNVVEQGPGLRSRAIKIEPTTVRYLRIATAEGDGYYSIAEFAAYCRLPTPFPPQMRLLDAPMAVGPIPATEHRSIRPAWRPKGFLGPFERSWRQRCCCSGQRVS